MSRLTAHIAGQETLGTFHLVRLHCPQLAERLHPGHFILARVLPTWDPYLRTALFPARVDRLSCLIYIPPDAGRAASLLLHAPTGTPIHVWGPAGHPFPPPRPQSNVLIIAQEPFVPYVLGLAHTASHVADTVLLVERTGNALPSDLGWLSPSVEFHQVPAEGNALETACHTLIPWADVVFVAGPRHWPRYIAHLLEQTWPLLEPGRAYAILPHGITCGLGLCDRCALDTPRGRLRACRKGPVLDLGEWFATRRRR